MDAPESADILITNGILLTVDDNETTIENGAVAVTADTITAVGSASELSTIAAKETIDAKGGIIMPGLVNAHTHAAMTCFRGLADDLPLMEWLNDHIFPAEANLDHEKVRRGTTLACAEMIRSGTTTFCDMYLFEGAVAEAAKAAGMRAVVGEVLYDFPSPNYGPLDAGFDYTEFLIRRWKDDPLISIAVEPHSPYLCAPELLQRAAETARSHGARLVIHLSETESEVEQIVEKYGKRPVAHLAELGVLGDNLIACHCVVLDDADIALLKRFDVKVVHNPESNMKLASGVAPVPKLIAEGITVAIGTDGCSSNNDLDMFGEMDTAAKLHKGFTLDPTVTDAATVLRMATINGAKALGLDGITGSIEVGKRADIIVIDTRKPHLVPIYHPESHLVYAVRGDDVVTSLINGRVVMRNGVLTTIDEGEAMAAVAEIADGMRRWR